jgi:hypothetical protein
VDERGITSHQLTTERRICSRFRPYEC